MKKHLGNDQDPFSCRFNLEKNEMKYFNKILHGKKPDKEFKPLLTGEAARAAIATADALTKSKLEDRKVKLREIIGR